ncbi:hypothetical protein [Aurantibacter sp.]|uniref:hypothetical protein n=1 Tax=Aurantibacter sp. TaxID=2807103 RepID=UPI0032631E41
MQKTFFLGLMFLLFSCDDGDIEIETIDFDSVDIETCETGSIDTGLFFKINDDEALILELEDGKLLNEASAEQIESTIGSGSTLTYRLFSGTVSKTYFCDDVPVIDPQAISEIVASNGTVLINTIEIDSTTFEHSIELTDVTFETDTNNRITDLTINDFGTFTSIKSE